MTAPSVFRGQLMHQRLQPFEHKFSYAIQYVHTPIDRITSLPLSNQRWSLLSLRPEDHGDYQSRDLEPWARSLLRAHDFQTDIASFNLLAIPRSLGLHFNPVSFWFGVDAAHSLRAVICQVNNTFGENHSYLCHKSDYSVIAAADRLSLDKKLHVSPFFPRVGHYSFKFDYRPPSSISVVIDYHDQGQCQLRTSLIGNLSPLDSTSRWRILRAQPFIGLGAYARIHRQAWSLWRRGARYHSKPQQLQPNTSSHQ